MTGDANQSPTADQGPPAAPSPAATAASAETAGAPRLRLPSSSWAAGAALAALLIALAAAGLILARRSIAEPAAPSPTEAPRAATLDLGAAAPHAAETPAAKILNHADGALKDGAKAVGAAPSAPGAINALPPAPAGGAANRALQDAAKDAAQQFAANHAAEEALVGEVANLKSELQDEIGALAENLRQERQRSEEKTAEIIRLNAELERMRASGAPALQRARAALAFEALADRARAGLPYRRELAAYEAAPDAPPVDPAIAAFADAGLPQIAALAADFAALRDAALAAARREQAKGVLARLGAELATLVRLRPARARRGSAPAALLSRAEAALAAGDLAGAAGELAALEGAAKEAFAPWLARARARLAAERALAAGRAAFLAAAEAGSEVR
jgi:hypothetical protein